MATAKFKMPTDKQIWAEVDAFLDAYPEAVKAIRKPPSRETLFKSKKSGYENTPKRLAAEAKAKKDKAIAIKEADKAYLTLRKKQGKPIVTLKELVAKYPHISFESSYTQQKLHETAEILEQLAALEKLRHEVNRVELASRRLQMKHLSEAYGVYRSINKCEFAEETFEKMRSALWNVFKIKTHDDLPRPTLLLKMVFKGVSEKTFHLYSRTFLIADSYDVLQADFESFITELGGMEKIRKAYATVIAADAGKLVPKYVKQSEEYASIQALGKLKPFVVQLSSGQTASFKNDIFGEYGLVLARSGTMDQLELYCHVPSTTAIENYVLKWVGDTAKDKKVSGWFADKDFAVSGNIKKGIVAYQEKVRKNEEKAVAKKKKEDARAKKDAAEAKRFEKQRANSKLTKVK
ncbi:hypothetical protein B9Z35_07200 [Limnohabitans sp. Jir61]|uniref:hypothetical protein n=1 Tax=Limnohabitans sp. Jir61 TaxID=1826168 RepID=UPI000D3D674E|nr:hypothetical protein [Limnohabitans sp. Jir61]PUE30831.1 hypothetical protein B9Z35_07200 [Limnohabitans sp. Jir61]